LRKTDLKLDKAIREILKSIYELNKIVFKEIGISIGIEVSSDNLDS